MIFWIDKHGQEYYKSEIDNDYLLNIAKGLTRGVGHTDFCLENNVISNIYEECVNRGLLTAEAAHKMEGDAVDAFQRKRDLEFEILANQDEGVFASGDR